MFITFHRLISWRSAMDRQIAASSSVPAPPKAIAASKPMEAMPASKTNLRFLASPSTRVRRGYWRAKVINVPLFSNKQWQSLQRTNSNSSSWASSMCHLHVLFSFNRCSSTLKRVGTASLSSKATLARILKARSLLNSKRFRTCRWKRIIFKLHRRYRTISRARNRSSRSTTRILRRHWPVRV